MDKAVVVGWGATGTWNDTQIDIVPTAAQQKLQMPLLSNEDCGTKYLEEVAIDLRGEIRYYSCVLCIVDVMLALFSVKVCIFALEVKREQTAVR